MARSQITRDLTITDTVGTHAPAGSRPCIYQLIAILSVDNRGAQQQKSVVFLWSEHNLSLTTTSHPTAPRAAPAQLCPTTFYTTYSVQLQTTGPANPVTRRPLCWRMHADKRASGAVDNIRAQARSQCAIHRHHTTRSGLSGGFWCVIAIILIGWM